MTTWTRTAPAFGGYFEHAAVDGYPLTIRLTPNGVWTASIGAEKIRGAFRTDSAARTAAERTARQHPVQSYRCPCCGDDVMDTRPVCRDCREADCAQTTDAGGSTGYTNCARSDGYADGAA